MTTSGRPDDISNIAATVEGGDGTLLWLNASSFPAPMGQNIAQMLQDISSNMQAAGNWSNIKVVSNAVSGRYGNLVGAIGLLPFGDGIYWLVAGVGGVGTATDAVSAGKALIGFALAIN